MSEQKKIEASKVVSKQRKIIGGKEHFKRIWTEEEIKLLTELYPNHSNEEIAKILGRSKPSVDKKAAQLGLKKSEEYRRKVSKQNNMKKEYTWTQEEVNFLMINFKTMTYKQLSEALGRSPSSIAHKARQLKLRKYAKHKKEEQNQSHSNT